MLDWGDSVSPQRSLGCELRALRIGSGLSRNEIASRAFDGDEILLCGIELGLVVPTQGQAALVAEILGTDPSNLLEGVRAVQRDSPRNLAPLRGVMDEASYAYLQFEEGFAGLRQYEPLIIPGPLQTEQYTRMLLGDTFGFTRQIIDLHVASRSARQAQVAERGRNAHFIIHENVLKGMAGRREVVESQMLRLRELDDLPNLTISVLPSGISLQKGALHPFVLLELADPWELDVLYLEGYLTGTVHRGGEHYVQHLEAFLRLVELSEDLASHVSNEGSH